jgi:hypothetical protein
MDPNVIPSSIQDLAVYDPIAALGILLHVPRVPISMNAAVSFSSFDVGQPPLEGDLDTTITQRTWIDNIAYSLQQPNVFAGNIQKTQYDAYLKQQPGLSVQIQVHSGPRYLVSPAYTPLENFTNLFAMRWSKGWPLFKNQSIKVFFQLTQAPPATAPNGPPYDVTMTFNGWQFLDHTLDNLSADDAAKQLRAMGFCVPCVPCVRQE